MPPLGIIDPLSLLIVAYDRVRIIDRAEVFPRPAHPAQGLVAWVPGVEGAAAPGTDHEGWRREGLQSVVDSFDLGDRAGAVLFEGIELLFRAAPEISISPCDMREKQSVRGKECGEPCHCRRAAGVHWGVRHWV